ncbi:hypothetical protein QTP88_028285 [Uroleucon formosanum]
MLYIVCIVIGVSKQQLGPSPDLRRGARRLNLGDPVDCDLTVKGRCVTTERYPNISQQIVFVERKNCRR